MFIKKEWPLFVSWQTKKGALFFVFHTNLNTIHHPSVLLFCFRQFIVTILLTENSFLACDLTFHFCPPRLIYICCTLIVLAFMKKREKKHERILIERESQYWYVLVAMVVIQHQHQHHHHHDFLCLSQPKSVFLFFSVRAFTSIVLQILAGKILHLIPQLSASLPRKVFSFSS